MVVRVCDVCRSFSFFAASLVTDFATLTGVDQRREGEEGGGLEGEMTSSLHFAFLSTSKCVFLTPEILKQFLA